MAAGEVSGALGAWISAATIATGPDGARFVLPNGERPERETGEFLLSLTGDTRGRGAAEERFVAALSAASQIAAGDRMHPSAAPIANQFRYYDSHVARVNGRGLASLIEPFAPPCSITEARAILQTALAEFVQNVGTILAEARLLPMVERGEAPEARVVVVNGLHRTGSTRVFLALQAVLREAGHPYRVTSCDFENVDALIARAEWGAGRGAWLLVKSHRWMPRRPSPNVTVFYTRRALADVMASSWRRQMQISPEHAATHEAVLKATLTNYKFVDEYVVPLYNLFVVEYETYADRDGDLIKIVADHLGVHLHPDQIAAAAETISPERVRTVSLAMTEPDHSTMIQPIHVSDTLGRPKAGLGSLPASLVKALREYGEWPDLEGEQDKHDTGAVS